MSLDAAVKARIQAQHRAEREVMADRHRDERQQLTHMANTARQREVEESRKRTRGHSDVRVKSAEADVKDRVAAHAKLKVKQRSEYDAMTKRHQKEMEHAEAGKPLPAHHQIAAGATQLGKVWGATSPKEQAEYRAIVAKHKNSHNEQHVADEAKKDRLSRYRSSAMTAKLEESRLAKHTEINRRQEAELSSLRRRIERRQGGA
jgi:hypothetical protein